VAVRLPPPPPAPEGCDGGFLDRFSGCAEAPHCCAPGDGCFARPPPRQYKQCRPLSLPCTDTAQWLCPADGAPPAVAAAPPPSWHDTAVIRTQVSPPPPRRWESPPPPVPCKPYCRLNTKPWSEKCRWRDCRGCSSECAAAAPGPGPGPAAGEGATRATGSAAHGAVPMGAGSSSGMGLDGALGWALVILLGLAGTALLW